MYVCMSVYMRVGMCARGRAPRVQVTLVPSDVRSMSEGSLRQLLLITYIAEIISEFIFISLHKRELRGSVMPKEISSNEIAF